MSWRALVGLIIAILIVAAVGGTILYVRRQPGPTAPPTAAAPAAPEPVPAARVEELTSEHYESGKRAWKISLASLAVEKGGRTITTGQLREGLIYDKKGRPAVRVTANQVNYDTTKYDFDVAGSVRVVSPKGAVISTEKVHWDNTSRSLSAPGRVTVRVKGTSVTTSGLRFDTRTQTVYCPNQVRIDTGRSDGLGVNLVYNLDTERWSLQRVQMVIDVQEAREKTGVQ